MFLLEGMGLQLQIANSDRNRRMARQAQDVESEHAFEGDGLYDPAEENMLLARDCDARIDPVIVGEPRNVAIKVCVQNFRAMINAGKMNFLRSAAPFAVTIAVAKGARARKMKVRTL
jgi:hypothetical protein